MMRFISDETIDKTRKALKCGVKEALQELHPCAAVYTRVEGGYIVFDSHADYATWRAQR